MNRNELYTMTEAGFSRLSEKKQAEFTEAVSIEAQRVLESILGFYDIAGVGEANFFIPRHPDRVTPETEQAGIDLLRRWYTGEQMRHFSDRLHSAPLRLCPASQLRQNQPRPGYQGPRRRPALDLSQPRTWRNQS